MASHNWFLATLNEERNAHYLQLHIVLNGEMLSSGFVSPKRTSIVLQKMQKQKHVN